MIFLLLAFQWVHAAPIKQDTAHMIKNVRQILTNNSHLENIREFGPNGYKQLVELSNSSREPMEIRWNAMMAMAKIGGEYSVPDLEKNISNSLWYVRSGALNALSLVEKDHGVSRAKTILKNDPALLVRASALQLLAQQKNKDQSFLWTELYNPLNFDNGQSLSIRGSILKVIAQSPQKKEAPKYIALIRDKDPKIRDLAVRALESISRKKSPATPVQDSVVAYWQGWYDKANF